MSIDEKDCVWPPLATVKKVDDIKPKAVKAKKTVKAKKVADVEPEVDDVKAKKTVKAKKVADVEPEVDDVKPKAVKAKKTVKAKKVVDVEPEVDDDTPKAVKDCVWPAPENLIIKKVADVDPPAVKAKKVADVDPPIVNMDDTQAKDMKAYILEALEKLRKKEMAEKQPFKARAYAVVLGQIKTISGPITSFEQISELKGVGTKIKAKLQEIFETGKLAQVQEYDSSDKMKIFEQLTQVHGIGPVKARDLIDNAGIKSIEELEGRQELLNDVQKKGLKYYKDTILRIPRAEMEKHEAYIMSVIKSFGKDIVASLSGSYRRKEATSGDVDCLITNCDEATYKKIIQEFVSQKYITDILAQGNKKVLAVGKLKMRRHFRRIDFMLTQPHEYPFALLYFTGSGPFNVAMRNFALSKGYSLSEYGLKDTSGKFVDGDTFHTEEDIFKFLGLRYIAPENRVNVKDVLSLTSA
jgi:DNA polymerase beta